MYGTSVKIRDLCTLYAVDA